METIILLLISLIAILIVIFGSLIIVKIAYERNRADIERMNKEADEFAKKLREKGFEL